MCAIQLLPTSNSPLILCIFLVKVGEGVYSYLSILCVGFGIHASKIKTGKNPNSVGHTLTFSEKITYSSFHIDCLT